MSTLETLNLEDLNNMQQSANQIANAFDSLWTALQWGIIIGVILYVVVNILIIVAIVNYAAVKNSEAFDYEKLAKLIAKEMSKQQSKASN